jgi:hypothetical protein
MISDRQIRQICSLTIACILFAIGVWFAKQLQTEPDFNIPVEEIPLEYR